MPLQNRVTPFNRLEAAHERGTLMGNRGILHDAEKRIGNSTWKHKRWLACSLSFKGRKRGIMIPGEYTALFFLDEAVSLAAGHRPCRECRKADFDAFVAAWRKASEVDEARRISADEMDAALHLSRIEGRHQARFVSALRHLPNATFISIPDGPNEAWLLYRGKLHLWSHGGYIETRTFDPEAQVHVLTPLRTVEVLRAGYAPFVHASAE